MFFLLLQKYGNDFSGIGHWSSEASMALEGMTFRTKKFLKLTSYNEALVTACGIALRDNCQYWLKSIIKGYFLLSLINHNDFWLATCAVGRTYGASRTPLLPLSCSDFEQLEVVYSFYWLPSFRPFGKSSILDSPNPKRLISKSLNRRQ